MNYKLTIDAGLTKQHSPEAMGTLRRWLSEGKIALVEEGPSQPNPSNASYNWPGLPPKAATPRGKYKPKAKSSTTFREVAAVLFPHRDAQKLSMGEINNVAHIVKHIDSRNEIFVTANQETFIADGKRDRLKRTFGLVAMTPDEVVATLSKIEGWK